MKKILMVAVMAIVALTANAQSNTMRDEGTITIQPKIGIGFGVLSGSWESTNRDAKTRVGFLVGAEGEYYVNDWLGVAAGINYAQQGWKWKVKSTGNKYTDKLDYLNIPITANFYVLPGFALKAGAQFGFLLNAKDDGDDVKDKCKKFNFAIPVGLSYEYENVVLDARYNISVTKVNKDGSDKMRSDLIQITVGYKFEL
jgi:opacity protein-like surface antigen